MADATTTTTSMLPPRAMHLRSFVPFPSRTMAVPKPLPSVKTIRNKLVGRCRSVLYPNNSSNNNSKRRTRHRPTRRRHHHGSNRRRMPQKYNRRRHRPTGLPPIKGKIRADNYTTETKGTSATTTTIPRRRLLLVRLYPKRNQKYQWRPASHHPHHQVGHRHRRRNPVQLVPTRIILPIAAMALT